MSEIHEISQHLNELRARILRIVIAIGIITIFVLTFHLTPVEVNEIQLYYPTLEPLNNIAAQITNYMKDQLVPEQVQLIQTAPGQAFFAQIYIAALVGIVFGMPIIVKELTGFIRPALKEREIHVSRSIAAPAVGLFAAGCIFSYSFLIFFTSMESLQGLLRF
jgi:sec-independent protein translocase protein TatC